MTYKLIKNILGVERIDTGSFIPFDPANNDYQAYLKWLAEGNEPLPADEPQQQVVAETVVTEPAVEEAPSADEPNI